MNLAAHAEASANVRRAAEMAAGVAKNLRTLNDGPVFGHEKDKLCTEVEAWMAELARYLGYSLAREPA